MHADVSQFLILVSIHSWWVSGCDVTRSPRSNERTLQKLSKILQSFVSMIRISSLMDFNVTVNQQENFCSLLYLIADRVLFLCAFSGRCFRLLVHSSQSFSAVINNHLQFTLTRITWDLVCSEAIEGNPRRKKTVITFDIYLDPISIPKIGTCFQSRKAEKVCQKRTKISICYS